MGFFAAQADFATYLLSIFFFGIRGFLNFEYSIGVVEVVGVADGESFYIVFHLDDHVFDSTHFDNISRFYVR